MGRSLPIQRQGLDLLTVSTTAYLMRVVKLRIK